jgi:alkanesulfonate monooxygenase SsuD/methylene tetrahydromethanopterin reductase-like flavin-dependent oxidoreductase (luciferase family)
VSGGRLRLGVGIGWNAVEYEALGVSRRGQRLEEQALLLRSLWTQPSVTCEGRFDRVTGAGIAPLPVQRPIPLWSGGASDPAYRRMGRLADGWFPLMAPGPRLDAARQIIAASATEAGRDPSELGMEGRVTWHGDPDEIAATAEQWRALGATHLSINTMGSGLASVGDHLGVLAACARALDLTAP